MAHRSENTHTTHWCRGSRGRRGRGWSALPLPRLAGFITPPRTLRRAESPPASSLWVGPSLGCCRRRRRRCRLLRAAAVLPVLTVLATCSRLGPPSPPLHGCLRLYLRGDGKAPLVYPVGRGLYHVVEAFIAGSFQARVEPVQVGGTVSQMRHYRGRLPVSLAIWSRLLLVPDFG